MKEYELAYEEGAWAEINLSRLLENLKIIQNYAGENTGIGAIVKADSYGLGAEQIVKVLKKEQCVKMFIVGKLLEAREIIPYTETTPVLILDRLSAVGIVDDMGDYITKQVIYSAYSLEFLQQLNQLGQEKDIIFQVHLRVDLWNSGMGFLPEQITQELFSLPYVSVAGIYTHLQSSYQFDWEKSEGELCRFDRVINSIPENIREKLTIHAQNSPLIFTHPNHKYNMVRSGTALYGLPCHPHNTYGLMPLLSLKAKIVNISKLEGEGGVSYRKHNNVSKYNIARFLFGYWDCPFLMTQENVKVWINGKMYSVVEEACMDSACIDTQGASIAVGDEVVLMGEKEGVRLREILTRHNIDLVHSEHLYILSKRLRRIYYMEEKKV